MSNRQHNSGLCLEELSLSVKCQEHLSRYKRAEATTMTLRTPVPSTAQCSTLNNAKEHLRAPLSRFCDFQSNQLTNLKV